MILSDSGLTLPYSLVRGSLGLPSRALRTRENGLAGATDGVIPDEMKTNCVGASVKPDPMETALNLGTGFFGALLVAMVGIAVDGGSDQIWLMSLLVVLVVTSYGQSFLPAACNGSVFGLFYNAFFLSFDRRLHFEDASDWLLEASFIAVAICVAALGYGVRYVKRGQQRTQANPADTHKMYEWQRDRALPTPRRRHRWTR